MIFFWDIVPGSHAPMLVYYGLGYIGNGMFGVAPAVGGGPPKIRMLTGMGL